MFACAQCGKRYDAPGYCAADGSPLVGAADPLIGTEVGRYRITSVIGEGGMGRVYLGVHPTIGSRVAVKVLSDQCTHNPELLERFFHEARSVNMIRHENIVSVIDMATLPDGRPFIVMEFIEGNTLAGLLRSGRKPLGGIVQLMSEVLSALGAAHAIGIVHRDLKPDNILVTGEGHAKVLDFGIAKLGPGLAHGSPRTATGALLGTPAYMAPEQISGTTVVDARTDVYAAGVVLYEAVTGQCPFQGETLFDLMRQHVHDLPRPPRHLRPDLSATFEAVILTALAKNPEERFQAAAAMVAALQRAAAELPPEEWKALSSRANAISLRGSTPSLPPPLMGPDAAPTRPGSSPTPGPYSPNPPRDPTGAVISREPYSPMRPEAQATVPAHPAPTQKRGIHKGALLVAFLGILALAVGIGLVVGTRRGAATPAVVVGPGVQIGSSTAVGPGPGSAAVGSAAGVPPPGPVAIATPDAAAVPGITTTPPVRTQAPPPSTAKGVKLDPEHFDAVAFLPEAQRLAKAEVADAGFTRMDVPFVRADGLADLTKTEDAVEYYFRAPSLSDRPSDVPPNVEYELLCYVEVTVTAKDVTVAKRSLSAIDESCRWPIRPLPRCTMAKVWQKAIDAGADKRTVAKISFLSDGEWFFDNEFDDTGLVASYPDECK